MTIHSKSINRCEVLVDSECERHSEESRLPDCTRLINQPSIPDLSQRYFIGLAPRPGANQSAFSRCETDRIGPALRPKKPMAGFKGVPVNEMVGILARDKAAVGGIDHVEKQW